MEVHFINVGFGNMILIILPNNTVFLYDCNLTEDNKGDILGYFCKVLKDNTMIDVFVNSHRDADHMRGIQIVHQNYPIQEIWDSGVSGTTTDTNEYETYMRLRRQIPCKEVEARKYWTYGEAKLRCMNSKDDDYSDANEQSIIMKIEYKGSSVLLAGDTNYRPWKEKILPFYKNGVHCSILLAAHHGSLAFFDDPSDSQYYYTEHIGMIRPAMTIISVGPNVHDLPDSKAVELYKKYSTGSNKGNKVYTTEEKGNMRLVVKDEGDWQLSIDQ